MFAQAWQAAVTKKNVQSGFRACGIYPFNPKAIPSEAYLPSTPFDRPQPTLASSTDSQVIAEVAAEVVTVVQPGTSIVTPEQLIALTVANPAEGDPAPTSFDPEEPTAARPAEGDGMETSSSAVLQADWDSAVTDIFAIPKLPPRKGSEASSRAITSHRILTSEEIIAAKLKKQQDKANKEKVKQERREIKEKKNAAKLLGVKL